MNTKIKQLAKILRNIDDDYLSYQDCIVDIWDNVLDALEGTDTYDRASSAIDAFNVSPMHDRDAIQCIKELRVCLRYHLKRPISFFAN